MRFGRVSSLVCMVIAIAPLFVANSAEARRFEILEGDDYDLIFSTSRGIRFRSTDPALEFRLGGRLHGDLAFFEDDRTRIDDFDGQVRRGRIYLRGRVFEDFGFKIEREFAAAREGWRNLWIRYRPSRSVSLKLGNFVAPFGLQDIASSNYSTLMERSASSALAPSYQTGARLDLNGRIGRRRSRNRWTLSVSASTSPLAQASDDQHRSDHFGLAVRTTFAPIARKRAVVHVGLAVEYRELLDGSGYRIRARPESGLAPALLDTGLLGDVDSIVSLGIEGAVLSGPFTVQGEYMRSFLQRNAGRNDVGFDGGYFQISYVVTGERRRYSRSLGVIRGVKPRHAWGALEVAGRFSTLDLNADDVSGGRLRDWTVGVNWYLRENLRVMFNYVKVDGRRRGPAPVSDDPEIFEMRFQLFF